MKVEDGMSEQVLTIGPAHTLREAARMMAARKVGAAVVVNPDHAGVGILTERDILMSVAAGQNPDEEVAEEHCTQDIVFAGAALDHGGRRGGHGAGRLPAPRGGRGARGGRPAVNARHRPLLVGDADSRRRRPRQTALRWPSRADLACVPAQPAAP